MKLAQLRPARGARKRRRRLGRGIAAGQGKTCGRGMKGQKARGQVKPGFEGGQTPLFRRLPKVRGQSNKAMNIGRFRREYATINVGQLESFAAGSLVTPRLLLRKRIIKDLKSGLKVLGEGSLSKQLTVQAHAFSAGAREKIETVGGQAVELPA